jgi:sugar lactone lactonase YvrE
MRALRSVLSLIVLVAGCTTAAGPSTTAPVATTQLPTSTVEPSTHATTSTTSITTRTTASPSTELVLYAVAEESSRRVALFTETDAPPCVDEERAPCGPFELSATIDLPHRPHNMTAAGPVLWVTHPSAGKVTRIELTGSSVVTQPLGDEPHDVKLSPEGHLLYVADEDGRALIVADPATLQELNRVELPAKPHDLAVDTAGSVWITLIGDDRLGRFQSGTVELFPTGRSPHDLIATSDGRIWFSNWNSDVLSIYNPITGTVEEAPAGVVEPHHFTVDAGGGIWVSDNGGSAVVGFDGRTPTTIPVGPVPHHIAFGDDIAIVAVSGSGQAVFIDRSGVIGRFDLTEGLHGAAVARLP